VGRRCPPIIAPIGAAEKTKSAESLGCRKHADVNRPMANKYCTSIDYKLPSQRLRGSGAYLDLDPDPGLGNSLGAAMQCMMVLRIAL